METKKCSNCGEPLTEGAQFCLNCGIKIQSEQTNGSAVGSENGEPKKKIVEKLVVFNDMLIIGRGVLGLFCFILAFVLAIIFFDDTAIAIVTALAGLSLVTTSAIYSVGSSLIKNNRQKDR